MEKDLRKKDYIWSYAGYIADISVYAILTPFLTVLLSSFELGLWYTFTGFYSFINLFDSGFSPIIMRNASYCMAGAKYLKKQGLPELGKEPNYDLVSALYKTNRKLVLGIAICIFLVGMVAGIPYIMYVTRSHFEYRFVIAWIIFLVGLSVNIYFIALPSFLKGIGAIAQGQKAIAIGRCIQLLTCILGVILGFGIVGLSIGICVGALSIGLVSSYYCKKIFSPYYVKKTATSCKYVLQCIWHNSWCLLAVAIGGYCTSQANTLICSTFLGLEVTASYGLTIQAIQAVGIVAFVYMQISIPGISRAKAEKNIERQKDLLGTSSVIFLFIDIIGNIAVILLVNPILKTIHAQTLIFSAGLVIIVAITNFLDKHSNLYSQFIVCGNEVPFVKASLLSGIAVIIISCTIVTLTDIGVIGLLLTQMIVQLIYNNWRWPYLVCRELETNILTINKLGLKNLKKMFLK